VSTHRKWGSHDDRVLVRPANPGDVDYIRSLSKRVFQQYGPYEDMVTHWFESGRTVTLLALMKKHPVGFVMLGRLEHPFYLPIVSEVLAVAVEPSRSRLGIGSLLMKEVQRKAKEIEVETLVLHTAIDNLVGQRLFRTCGFASSEIKKEFYPAGQDALMMYKEIA
jgi:ribosomal protein S18 acetylase RimI-like enzyme